MAGGEYVSVSSQRDIEKTVMAKETAELRDFPDEELEELTGIYTEKGSVSYTHLTLPTNREV